MKNKVKRILLKSKGITLITLVITIIVLLILAGITLSLTIGERGIITRAKQAGKNYLEEQERELADLNELTNEMESILEGSEYEISDDFKRVIAQAITDEGVSTSVDSTADTMAANIRKIFEERTKDATATADNISEGKIAYVNGKKIIGTGVDNKANYEQGKESVIDKVINNYFTGKTIVVDEHIYGPGIKDYCIFANIDPQIFSAVRYYASCWDGSASGNYPNSSCSKEFSVWLKDDITGEVLASDDYRGRPSSEVPNRSIEINKEWPNTVSIYATAIWIKGSYGDAVGTSKVGNIQLTIR